MKLIRYGLYWTICTLYSSLQSFSQNFNSGQIHGNFQLDAQYYNPDSAIGAPPVPEKMLMNGFSNINYTNGNFSAGLRYESYLNVLQGFPPGYKGNGIPYRYASYKIDELEVTVGNYYEQFGNGLVFRSYEERGLGIDNAMDGIRLKYAPIKGIYLKGLIGRQRLFFDYGPGIVRGVDGEMQINETITKLAGKKTKITLGGSFVSKFQSDQDPALELPENVAAWAGRMNLNSGKININAEYANKINDPSAVNGLIYKSGEALFLMTSYTQKGFSISLATKRIDNMSFKSDRTATKTNLNINYLPALTKQHTYNLLTFYPYATQPNGEIGFQGEILYKIKKGTKLGGKYGTDISVNLSSANGLDTTQINPIEDSAKRLGYKTNYFGVGEIYFKDYNVEISRKLSQKLKALIMYAYQEYNKNVVQGKPGVIYSHIGLLEITWRIRKEQAIRTELQHLYTEQDFKSWAHFLLEYTPNEKWFFTILDQYNYGNDDTDKRIHYYNVSLGFTKNTTRIALSYGKQREGIFCVGGICRQVPASNGLSLSVTSSF